MRTPRLPVVDRTDAPDDLNGLVRFAEWRNLFFTRVPSHFIWSLTFLLTYVLTYLLTPWCRVLLEKLTGLQPVKKFPVFYGTRRFITALTSVRQLSLSWVSPIQSINPNLTSWRSILILSTHLRLGLPSGLFPSGFPHQDPIRPPLLTHTRHMPSPSHSSRFYHPHNIVWGVQIRNMYRLTKYTKNKLCIKLVFLHTVILSV